MSDRPSSDDTYAALSGVVAPTRFAAKRLAAVVLLAGRPRPSPLVRAIGRAVLELPVDDGRTLLDLWCAEVVGIARTLGLPRLPIRIVVDREGVRPERPAGADLPELDVSVVRDPDAFRGTAGVLRDLTRHYSADEWVLVCNASQLPVLPLMGLLRELSCVDSGISMVTHEDGSVAGTMLLRCASLESVADVGFVDLKEQALPQIAESHGVRVVRKSIPTAISVRTLEQYVRALQFHHSRGTGNSIATLLDPYAERWRRTFSIIEPGAQVGTRAIVHDSVVLAGGRVGDGAVVVRSVVGPRGVVGARERVVNRAVGSEDGGR